MKLQKYVVVRSKSTGRRNLESLPMGPSMSPMDVDAANDIEVSSAELSAGEQERLAQDSNTRAIAPVMPVQLITPTEVDNEVAQPNSASTWGVSAVGADATGFNGSGITVAILDTGIDPGHPAFAGVNIVQRNFTSEGPDDSHGHGTHCAGTVFGRDVAGTRIGVATGVNRALIGKVLGAGGGSSASIASAIQWAVSEGAHVVSMSLGIDFPGFVKQLIEDGMDERPATSIALEAYRSNINVFSALAEFVRASDNFQQGCVLVAAAGNECNRPEFNIAVAPPAASAGILSVAALQQSANGLQVASFSNTNVDVSGPGVGILSARPGGGLTSMSGTSMATPHVAGVAALWAQRMLDVSGRVKGRALAANIIGNCDRASLVSDASTADVGEGIVQSPPIPA